MAFQIFLKITSIFDWILLKRLDFPKGELFFSITGSTVVSENGWRQLSEQLEVLLSLNASHLVNPFSNVKPQTHNSKVMHTCIHNPRYDKHLGDFSGSSVVRNPPSNARDAGLIPGWGTKIPHAPGQLCWCAANYRAHTLWSPCVTTNTQGSKK